MKKLDLTIIAIITIMLLNGCAVKQTDTMSTKVFKHTLNTPLYLGMILTKGTEVVVNSVAYGVIKTSEVLSNEDKVKD